MLKTFTQFGMAAAIAVLAAGIFTTSAPAGKGNGKGGGGGGGEDPGNEKVPSVIDFASGMPIGEDGLPVGAAEDTLPYVDENIAEATADCPSDEEPDPRPCAGQDQVEAFIGSQASQGGIFLRTWRDGDPVMREIAIDLSTTTRVDTLPYACQPPATGKFVLRYMEVDVDDEITGGVYSITSDNSPVASPMRLRMVSATDLAGPAYFMFFGGGDRGGCRDQLSSLVDVSRASGDDDPTLDHNDIWQVVPTANSPVACLERRGIKKKAEFCGLYELPFSFTLQAQPQP